MPGRSGAAGVDPDLWVEEPPVRDECLPEGGAVLRGAPRGPVAGSSTLEMAADRLGAQSEHAAQVLGGVAAQGGVETADLELPVGEVGHGRRCCRQSRVLGHMAEDRAADGVGGLDEPEGGLDPGERALRGAPGGEGSVPPRAEDDGERAESAERPDLQGEWDVVVEECVEDDEVTGEVPLLLEVGPGVDRGGDLDRVVSPLELAPQ